VVVELGVTLTDPFVPNAPIPAMSTEVALSVVQLRTAAVPVVMLLGFALNAIVGTWLVEFCGGAIDPPAHPMVAIRPPNRKMNPDMRRTNRIEIPSFEKLSGEVTKVSLGVTRIRRGCNSYPQEHATKYSEM
jgi:hypothetical protein